MEEKKQTGITPDEHHRQIETYGKEIPSYTLYANVLERVLKTACKVSIPEAFVQARAKTLSSFAEKCVRRFDRYSDAVNQMTDLCGARVIVQTIEQVKAVRWFIESNFEILERDDKALQLSEDKFGYRDLHYIIRLQSNQCPALGITPAEQESIGERRAEIQVRTWLQHAWADILHDRMYKNSLPLSTDLRRTGSLLAALMEEGDRNFDLMAGELDGMVANYTAFALRKDVEKEIEVQNLILQNEPKPENKPGLALKLARLLVACGDYEKVVSVLDPYHSIQDGNRAELLQYLGYALCKKNSNHPDSQDFLRGKRFLEESISRCSNTKFSFVPHLRRLEGLQARALSWMGWVEEQINNNEYKARTYRCRAHECEPSNPYYLADLLGFEKKFDSQPDLPKAMKTVVQEAIKTCKNHAKEGIELPLAFFTAGRLSLILDRSLEALGYYALGIQYILAGKYCFRPDVLSEETAWLKNLHFGKKPPEECQWVEDLLDLAVRITGSINPTEAPEKALFITGGAASMDQSTIQRIRPLVETALRTFKGKVICGGTISGVPGLVGEISKELAAKGEKHFQLVGYIPEHLPQDGPKDERYDRFIIIGLGRFNPEQLLRSWKDMLQEGVHPKEVLILGFGGGPLSALEYRLGLGFGASVAAVDEIGGAASELIQDSLWSKMPNLMPLPFDSMSVQAFVTRPKGAFKDEILEKMAMAFHSNYVDTSSDRLPENMKKWEKLNPTYRQANIEQARYAVSILESRGYCVRQVPTPSTFDDFTEEDIEQMAEMEHGRWNIERLRDGWRFGPRDDFKKLHDSLVKWSELPDSMKKYDLEAVKNFPSILAKEGFEVYRG